MKVIADKEVVNAEKMQEKMMTNAKRTKLIRSTCKKDTEQPKKRVQRQLVHTK